MDGTTSHSSTSSGKTNTRLANAVRNFLAERLKKTSLRQFVPILKASAASATTVSSPSLSSKASKSQSSSKERTEPLVVELPKGKAMKFDDFAHEAKGAYLSITCLIVLVCCCKLFVGVSFPIFRVFFQRSTSLTPLLIAIRSATTKSRNTQWMPTGIQVQRWCFPSNFNSSYGNSNLSTGATNQR